MCVSVWVSVRVGLGLGYKCVVGVRSGYKCEVRVRVMGKNVWWGLGLGLKCVVGIRVRVQMCGGG